MLGYGQTVLTPSLPRRSIHDLTRSHPQDAPRAPPLSPYSWKSAADDMVALLDQLEIPQVILLGHDWGGAVVQRMHLHHPARATHIASICTAYYPPIRHDITMAQLVEKVPSFRYQIAFCDPETERDLESVPEIERFLRCLHRGVGDGNAGSFMVESGMMRSLGDPERSRMLTQKVGGLRNDGKEGLMGGGRG